VCISVYSMLSRKNGIILIDKPAGISSAGVVARVKRALQAARVGHAGTLDPDATGLLIVLINGATRVASYAADGWKVYSGEIQLGVTTSTDDIAGNVLSTQEVTADFSSISAAAANLRGRIMQYPPKVSAKKLDGKRAYKLHRAGQDFELEPREVHVRRFELAPTNDPTTVSYITEVSPGTYVRSLARDLGATLSCGGAVKTIRREQSGYFSVSDAITLDQVSWDLLRDWSELVPSMPRVALSAEVVSGLQNGQKKALSQAWQECNLIEPISDYVVYSRKDEFGSLGILEIIPQGGFAFSLNIGH
jgi:tRNA pseudouridine55 synthase